MSIQPIDLQVLFSRLGEVGKEQAALKDVSVHNQGVQGNELAKKTEHENRSVNESPEIENDGLRMIKDEKRQGRKKSGGDSEKEERGGEEETPQKEILREPYLGKNIDITG